jgi:hypothetical protein
MNKFKLRFAACATASLVVLNATPALALESFWTPLQLSLTPPVQLPNESCTVYGLSLGMLRVGIHTKLPKDALGLDHEDVVGLQLAGYDCYAKELYGAQAALFFASCSQRLIGLQMSGVGNFAHDMPLGVQLGGLANYLRSGMGVGGQLAGICNEYQTGAGVQAALGWNQCVSGTGLQLAVANTAISDFTGLQFGLFNWGEGRNGRVEKRHEIMDDGRVQSFGRPTSSHTGVGELLGVQAGLVNKAVELYGVQAGLLWNDAAMVRGLQVGALNTAEGVAGIQFGLLNSRPKAVTGVQVGLINRADHVTGVQVGFFNLAKSMTGIQLGLLNIIEENAVLLLPLVNAHF